MTAANLLTVSRLLLTAPIVVLFHLGGAPAAWAALGLFILAMLTDVVDGKLARRDPERSPLGNYLDPVADKVLLMSLFVCLAGRGVIPAWVAALLVAREFVVEGIRSTGAAMGKVVGSNWMGKAKTAVQSLSVSCALLGRALAAEYAFEDWRREASALLLSVAWWTALVVALAAAVFAAVFVFWNRSILSSRPDRRHP